MMNSISHIRTRLYQLVVFVGMVFLVTAISPLLVDSASTDYFRTTWDTTLPGSSSSTAITIPTNGTGYVYDVDWDNDGTFDEFGLTGDVTHDFGTPGTYTIQIQGLFPTIYFNNTGDTQKITSIDQWGTQVWSTFEKSFWGSSNLVINATDYPDLSSVTNLRYMFYSATSIGTGSHDFAWTTTNITNMQGTFLSASSLIRILVVGIPQTLHRSF